MSRSGRQRTGPRPTTTAAVQQKEQKADPTRLGPCWSDTPMERTPGSDDPQEDLEYDVTRRRPTAEMRRRALVHEAGFIVVAAALNGPDWVMRVERVRGHPRTATIADELPYYVTDHQSVRHVVALLASIEAERLLFGEASFLGHLRMSQALGWLRRRFSAGLEPDLPAVGDELGSEQEARVAQLFASARTQAVQTVAERADQIERMADILRDRPRLRGRQLHAAVSEVLDAR